MGPTKQIGKWRPEEYYLLEVPKKKETYILVTQLKKESLAKVRLGKAAGVLNSFKR